MPDGPSSDGRPILASFKAPSTSGRGTSSNLPRSSNCDEATVFRYVDDTMRRSVPSRRAQLMLPTPQELDEELEINEQFR